MPSFVPGRGREGTRFADERAGRTSGPAGTAPDEGPTPGETESVADMRARAELRKLLIDIERAELDLAALRRRDADAQSEPAASNVYTFYSEVTAASVQDCMAELGRWSRRRPGSPITVVFNSTGGSVLDGLALYDYLRLLRSEGHHVTTMALGRAASMGAVLLQAGDERVLGANSFLLVHEVTSGTTGTTSELEDSVDFTRRLQGRLLAILSERSTLTPRQIQTRWARKEWWLDAQEALALGFADSVR